MSGELTEKFSNLFDQKQHFDFVSLFAFFFSHQAPQTSTNTEFGFSAKELLNH
jgi:hypothetical protein